MDKLSIDKRLQILSEQLIRARIHYDFWWFLEGEDSFSQIKKTLNKFSEFFLVDTNAHFANMIIRSAVVWDETKGTISLPRLARDILDTARFSEHAAIDANIQRLKVAACGIIKVRHEAIAHVTDKADRTKVFEDANIFPNTLVGMMKEWLEVINELRKIRKIGEIDFRDLPLIHLQKLIHRLGGPDLRPKSLLDEILGE